MSLFNVGLVDGFPVGREFSEAEMPLASAVPRGLVVWNSTYKVNLRSNGTRWEAQGPFVAGQETRTDQVVGAATESLLHSVNISDAVRYMGPKGGLVIDTGWSHTSSTNGKGMYVRMATTAGIGGTGILTLSGTNSTASTTSVKRVRAQGSESVQAGSNASLGGEGSQASSHMAGTFNFAEGGDTVIISFSGAATGAGENVTLRWYRIVIEPGY